MKRLLLASVALCGGLGSVTLAADFPPYAAPPGGPLLRPAPGGTRVERSLYQRAKGYSYDAVKIFMPANRAKPVYAKYIEHVPAPPLMSLRV